MKLEIEPYKRGTLGDIIGHKCIIRKENILFKVESFY